MTIIHWIGAFLTIPGTVLRAFWEHIVLKIMRVPVEDTSYLQRNEMCGHVEHKPVRTLGKSFALCVVPGLLVCLLGLAMALPAALQLFYMGVTLFTLETGGVSPVFILCVVLYYCGMSLLCHAFPAYEDMLYLSEAYAEAKPLAKILLCVPVYCMRAGAFLERFGVFVLCGAALTALFILI